MYRAQNNNKTSGVALRLRIVNVAQKYSKIKLSSDGLMQWVFFGFEYLTQTEFLALRLSQS